MSTTCNGCKALVIQTADDYSVYVLQRPLYPVDPLMILPQPTSWVQLVCEDGFIAKKLYTQLDDFVTFYQQMLAECANHTIPTAPVVLSDPNTDSGDNPPPVVPLPPDPLPNIMPGPETVIPPPPVAPPPSTPTPAPQYPPPFGWPWVPPSETPWTPTPTNPHDKPELSEPVCPGGHWGCLHYITAIMYHPTDNGLGRSWELAYNLFFAYKVLHPLAYIESYLSSVFSVDEFGNPFEYRVDLTINRPICDDDPC